MNYELKLFLAPMEDVTDIGFRRLCKRYGAAMVYTEFVAAEALVRNVKDTVRKLTVSDDERPVGIQIYGRTVDAVVDAARIVEREAHPDVIDLNFGCPVKKVAGKGAGAGMLRQIPLMLQMTAAVADAVSTPVTVKTRLGWDDTAAKPGSGMGITDLAERLQDCGIAALTVHGRTREQMYRGEADWTLIADVKSNPRIHIPIIGNGDVTTPERARECFERYGVDAVMVGRASVGKPWVFREMKSFLQTGKQADPLSWDEQMALMKQMVLSNVEKLDEHRGILHSRRHLAATPLFKGIPNFRETRIAMLRATTLDSLFSILDGISPDNARH